MVFQFACHAVKARLKILLFKVLIHFRINLSLFMEILFYSFEMSVEMFDYLDNILDLQAAGIYKVIIFNF